MARKAPKGFMRVAIDASPLHPERGGIGTYTEGLIQALARTGSPPELILLSNVRPLFEDTPPRGVQLEVGPRGRDRLLARHRVLWRHAALPRLIDRVHPDLCHFPCFYMPEPVRCGRVVTIHDLSLFRRPDFFPLRKRLAARRLIRRAAATADAVITVSEASRRDIVEVLGVPTKHVHVVHEAPPDVFARAVPEPVLAEARQRLGLPDRYVLSVGMLEPRKNLLRLIAAVSALRARRGDLADVQLVIVGPSGYRAPAIRREIERRAGGAVRFLGYVTTADMCALYRLASVMAYPSLYEGFGLPVLEAMAAGTPVVTSNGAALSEVAGPAAEAVDPRNVADISRGLEAVLGNPARRSELVAAGRARAARFTWDEAAARTLEIYQRVLRPNGTARASRAARANGAPTRPSPPRGVLSRAILRTLHYADLFDYPLTLDQIYHDLVGVRANRHALERVLRTDAALARHVDVRAGYWFLRGREGLVELRKERARRADRLIDGHRALLRRIARIPCLRLLAFSGGTSHRNSPTRDDLDLFLVTTPGRSWLVYACVVALARLHRARALVCANYVVDTRNLAMPRRHDLFTAHELLHLRPLAGADVRGALFRENEWIASIYPNGTGAPEERLWPASAIDRRVRRVFELALAPFATGLDRAAGGIFARRIRRAARAARPGDVVTGAGVLKLHTTDHRRPIVQRYRERLAAVDLFDPDLGEMLRDDASAPVVAKRAG